MPGNRSLRVASHIRKGDHYILGKLDNELLPWMICGKHVGRRWFVYVSYIHSYPVDVAAALAGLGIGSPILKLLSGELPTGKTVVDVLQRSLPPGWCNAGIVAAIVWVVLRVVMKNEDVAARSLLAREFSRGISASYLQLHQALASSDPMPQIRIIQKSVDDRVQDAIKNGIWPWNPASDGKRKGTIP